MEAIIGVEGHKQQAAERALELVEPGMVLGLGEGSTSLLALRHLAALLADGRLKDISGVPSSRRMARQARRLGIPLTSLEATPCIDLTFDGADEVDPQLNLIKGGGGALLREKIIAQATRREVIMVDDSKLVPRLGSKWAVPVEVEPFGYGSQAAWLRSLGAEPALRLRDGQPFLTDGGNYILDCDFGPLDDAWTLARRLKARAGIVEHGLFMGLASDVIVAGNDGIRHLCPTDAGTQAGALARDV